MTEPRNIIGPIVRDLRTKKGLTQAALAAKLNIIGWDLSRDTLAKIEAQTRWVADFEIPLLAKSIGITPSELLSLAIDKAPKRTHS